MTQKADRREMASSTSTRAQSEEPAEPCLPSTFHLAVLAPEYPPQIGGMPSLARDLVAALSNHVQVSVFTRRGLGTGDPLVAEYLSLTTKPLADRRALDRVEVDAWLALNAGLIPLARTLRRPFFAYVHGNDFLRPWIPCGPRWLENIRRPYASKIRHSLRRRSIRKAIGLPRLIFCNSLRTADLIQTEMGLDDSSIQVSPPGVNQVFFSVPRTEPTEGLRILSVAKLSQSVSRKNIDGVIRAVGLLSDSINITYTVVGDGDDRPRLEKLATDLDLGSRITFLGSVDDDELLNCYSRADLFVLASKASAGDVEGFGIVYIEASAAGVPVICSLEGGATDAVQQGVNGLLIPESSPEAIANGITSFQQRRGSFDETKIRAFAEQFRWKHLAPRLLRELNASLRT